MKNKKKYIFIITILLLCSIILYLLNENHGLKESSNNYENNKITKRENMLSMMIETEANSGNYEMTTRDSWPTDGYVFNTELSKCENCGELSWDDANKTVLMSGNVSDKCYVYFDIYVAPALADYVKSLYTGTQGENNIYYHDSSLTKGAGDNSYRYSGADPNNYVCFGSDATPCPTDSLYRIIGVFDRQVKLIKATEATSTLLGTDGAYVSDTGYNWNSSGSVCHNSSGSQNNAIPNVYFETKLLSNSQLSLISNNSDCNKWKYSNLNTINLNTNFIANIGAEWTKKIAMTTWKVGGNTYANIAGQSAKIAYQNEITNAATTNEATEYSTKIGLMYASDYGFAAAPSAWTTNLTSYGDANIKSVNWMYMGLDEWTISHNVDNNNYDVFCVNHIRGICSYSPNIYNVAVRPVFSLTSSVNYASGSGSATDPIVIN